MTTEDTFCRQYPPTKEAMLLKRLMGILRAGRIELAVAIRVKKPERPMIKGECPLIETYQKLYKARHAINWSFLRQDSV
jgi:hypothetical protein